MELTQARREILEAAAACFMEQGFHATSIDVVARRMGATKGRVYHHYQSKVDLFFDVHRLGMALLFVALILRGGPGKNLQDTANGLLGHLSLLFVPAGAGIMLHADRLASEWQALLAALVISTLAALAVSALVLTFILRRRGSGS